MNNTEFKTAEPGEPMRFLMDVLSNPKLPGQPCTDWPYANKDPKTRRSYGLIWYNGKMERAHRLAWELYHQKPFPAGMQACHSCDRKSCIEPLHVEPGTNVENQIGNPAKGLRPTAKIRLRERDIEEIIRLESEGVPRKLISEQFGITRSHICNIVKGRRWAHVTEELDAVAT